MGTAGLLPFPLGGFWHDGNTDLLTSGDPQCINGNVYEVPNSKHLLGSTVKVRVVQLDGTAITGAKRGVAFGTGEGDFGRKVSGYVSAAGAVGKPIHESYNGLTIANGAQFYVVEEGPVDILYETSSVTTSNIVGGLVQFDGSGYIDDTPATDDDFVVGRLDENPTATNTAYRVMVEGGLINLGG